MKLRLNNNKNNNHPTEKQPVLFTQYKKSPLKYASKIAKQEKVNRNPLYSAQSLTKYFLAKPSPKKKDMVPQFYRKQKEIIKNQNILKFRELQQKLRKTQTQLRLTIKQADQYKKFIKKQMDHFTNLNLDDGFAPPSEQFHNNFLITCYLEKLKSPPKTQRMTYKKRVRLARVKAHTQNIEQNLKRYEIQSRYQNIPKSKKINQASPIVSWQRKNTELRSKTEYCSRQYKSPLFLKSKLDKQIIDQSRLYMSRQFRSTKSTHKF